MSLSKVYGKKPTRPHIDDYFMAMALLASTRSTCQRRKVGCILTDEHNQVLATGYNGVPKQRVHCIDSPCPGASSVSGKDLDECYAIHAEQNALLQCKDISKIWKCYTTTAPCVTCVKLLLNTPATKIVFLKPYGTCNISKMLWKESSRQWCQLTSHGLEEINNVIYRSLISTEF